MRWVNRRQECFGTRGCYTELKLVYTLTEYREVSTGSNDDDCTTYNLHVFSDPCFSRAGVLLPPCMSIGAKNCGRAAGIHPLQHIQSTSEMVKKQNRELDFPIIVFC